RLPPFAVAAKFTRSRAERVTLSERENPSNTLAPGPLRSARGCPGHAAGLCGGNPGTLSVDLREQAGAFAAARLLPARRPATPPRRRDMARRPSAGGVGD